MGIYIFLFIPFLLFAQQQQGGGPKTAEQLCIEQVEAKKQLVASSSCEWQPVSGATANNCGYFKNAVLPGGGYEGALACRASTGEKNLDYYFACSKCYTMPSADATDPQKKQSDQKKGASPDQKCQESMYEQEIAQCKWKFNTDMHYRHNIGGSVCASEWCEKGSELKEDKKTPGPGVQK
ncbi:MAG: hypothetical protein H6623_05660 [Bdellovibrionaceae bacterium]|nr:hypothetical protein [Pseudobdellovibrionaceae bacterium]